jgi:hypothetical protein
MEPSHGQYLEVPGCLRSKFTVWQEDKFTVMSGKGIWQRQKRVADLIAKELPKDTYGAWDAGS